MCSNYVNICRAGGGGAVTARQALSVMYVLAVSTALVAAVGPTGGCL